LAPVVLELSLVEHLKTVVPREPQQFLELLLLTVEAVEEVAVLAEMVLEERLFQVAQVVLILYSEP
jgi:hypothetical protein